MAEDGAWAVEPAEHVIAYSSSMLWGRGELSGACLADALAAMSR